MPAIQGTDLRDALRVHLLFRARERAFPGQDLLALKAWGESAPDAAGGPWFKEFGSIKTCGAGEHPNTSLLRGHWSPMGSATRRPSQREGSIDIDGQALGPQPRPSAIAEPPGIVEGVGPQSDVGPARRLVGLVGDPGQPPAPPIALFKSQEKTCASSTRRSGEGRCRERLFDHAARFERQSVGSFGGPVMRRALVTAAAVATLFLPPGDCWTAPDAKAAKIIDATAAADGTVLVVQCADGHRIVVVETALARESAARSVSIPGLPANATISAVRVASWGRYDAQSMLTLALVVRYADGRTEYRFASQSPRPGAPWYLTTPIFTETGAPWRIDSVRHTDFGVEIAYSRGVPDPSHGGESRPYEMRLYANCCPGDPDPLLDGVGRLWEMRRVP